jgi:hypothetical protein
MPLANSSGAVANGQGAGVTSAPRRFRDLICESAPAVAGPSSLGIGRSSLGPSCNDTGVVAHRERRRQRVPESWGVHAPVRFNKPRATPLRAQDLSVGDWRSLAQASAPSASPFSAWIVATADRE